MSDNEKTEFEFQDSEIEQPKRGLAIREPEPEIEIVDDTPEEDRGRTPMATPPQEPTDEELESYSKRDRNKIREFTKGYHEERRAKEAALREKEEAISLTKTLFDENQRLKGTVNTSQSALLEQAKRVVAQELEEARRKYKNAYEAGDSDALVNAQEEMTSAKMKVEIGRAHV